MWPKLGIGTEVPCTYIMFYVFSSIREEFMVCQSNAWHSFGCWRHIRQSWPSKSSRPHREQFSSKTTRTDSSVSGLLAQGRSFSFFICSSFIHWTNCVETNSCLIFHLAWLLFQPGFFRVSGLQSVETHLGLSRRSRCYTIRTQSPRAEGTSGPRCFLSCSILVSQHFTHCLYNY